tara:strand:+ start:302 stop:568 length:267 start_codon:yes stop_codon:yes gene_type:complete
MTDRTLQDRLRSAERDECCNDRMCDEAADATDNLRAEVARLRLVADEMAGAWESFQSYLRSTHDDGDARMDAAASAYRAALAHGEADQ